MSRPFLGNVCRRKPRFLGDLGKIEIVERSHERLSIVVRIPIRNGLIPRCQIFVGKAVDMNHDAAIPQEPVALFEYISKRAVGCFVQ